MTSPSLGVVSTDPAIPPPVDPRTDLPPFGSLPVVARLAEDLTRVVAPNPSAMTLDGTNTYVVSRPGSGVAVVVDPGPSPADPVWDASAAATHLGRVEAVLAALDAEVVTVAVTHHHLDHAAAAAGWARHFDCPVAAPSRAVAGRGGTVVAEGDVVGPAGARLVALATPGHCADHVAYRLADGGVLSGDHVLGRGTSVVAHPDGDLLAYLDSLRRLHALGPDALWPGHGPEVVEDPGAVLEYYAEHRAHRQRQVLGVLATRGPSTPREVVEVVYAGHDPRLLDAAEASTRAALAKLEAEGAVEVRGDGPRLVARLTAHARETDVTARGRGGSLTDDQP